jgi:hypothetical protein
MRDSFFPLPQFPNPNGNEECATVGEVDGMGDTLNELHSARTNALNSNTVAVYIIFS